MQGFMKWHERNCSRIRLELVQICDYVMETLVIFTIEISNIASVCSHHRVHYRYNTLKQHLSGETEWETEKVRTISCVYILSETI